VKWCIVTIIAFFSNPKVQIGSLEAGALELLIRQLSIQSSVALRRRLVFALSAQCRNFPYAQKRLLEIGGLSALAEIFEESGTDQLRVKIVSFINDMLMEKVLMHSYSCVLSVYNKDNTMLCTHTCVFYLSITKTILCFALILVYVICL